MSRLALVSLFVVAAGALGCHSTVAPHSAAAPAAHVPLPGRVVMISIDGMIPETYLDADARGLAIPTMRKLVAAGASARVRGVMPTVTYPSHTTLVTGVPPNVHGIFANKPLDPLGKNHDGWWWYAEDVKVPTLYQAVEAQHGTAAMISWPVTMGAHVSLIVPEYWRGGTDDQKLVRAISTPGVLDDAVRLEPRLWDYLTPPTVRDHAQMSIARAILAQHSPDLLLIHIFALDEAQHDHGPWSPEAKATIENADRELGTLLAELERSPDWPRTTLLVVSDHGFAPVDHEIHLGTLFVAHHLIELDARGAPTAAAVGMVVSGGTVAIYDLDPARAADIDAAVAELGAHVARRISHDELVALGGDPKAAFALVAAPGHAFSDKRTGDVVVEVSPRGTHGWPPDDPAMAASFIAYGSHVPHISLGTIDMLDIAPTVARWLGVPLPTAIGKPLAPLVP